MKTSFMEKTFISVIYLILTLLTLVTLYPVVYVLFIRLSINRNEDGVYDFTPAGLAAFDVLTAPMIKFDVKSGKISKGSYADITTYQQSKEQISYVFVSLRSGTVSNVFVINR